MLLSIFPLNPSHSRRKWASWKRSSSALFIWLFQAPIGTNFNDTDHCIKLHGFRGKWKIKAAEICTYAVLSMETFCNLCRIHMLHIWRVKYCSIFVNHLLNQKGVGFFFIPVSLGCSTIPSSTSCPATNIASNGKGFSQEILIS